MLLECPLLTQLFFVVFCFGFFNGFSFSAFVVTLQCLMERPDPISVFSADHPYALRLVALVGGVRACLFTGSVSEFSGDISKVASHT